MCGRYALVGPYKMDPAGLVEGWVEHIRNPLRDVALQAMALKNVARYNIAPTQMLPVLRLIDDQLVLQTRRWGLIPAWAKDQKLAFNTINARVESVTEKPSYRDAWKRAQRCLVPATGWYEWPEREDKKKQAYYFSSSTEFNLMMFAGLWSDWKNPQGEIISSYTILTTQAHSVVAQLHDRQPVIIEPAQWLDWLELPANEAEYFFRPQALSVKYHAVSAAVGNVRNEGAQLIEAI